MATRKVPTRIAGHCNLITTAQKKIQRVQRAFETAIRVDRHALHTLHRRARLLPCAIAVRGSRCRAVARDVRKCRCRRRFFDCAANIFDTANGASTIRAARARIVGADLIVFTTLEKNSADSSPLRSRAPLDAEKNARIASNRFGEARGAQAIARRGGAEIALATVRVSP